MNSRFTQALIDNGAVLMLHKRETYDFHGLFTYSPVCGDLGPLFIGDEKLLPVLEEWLKVMDGSNHLRLGQALYVSLTYSCNTFSQEILASNEDPFYDDRKVLQCLKKFVS